MGMSPSMMCMMGGMPAMQGAVPATSSSAGVGVVANASAIASGCCGSIPGATATSAVPAAMQFPAGMMANPMMGINPAMMGMNPAMMGVNPAMMGAMAAAPT